MINDAQILSREFDLLKQELADKHTQLGMKASGKWLESLENRSERLSGQIWGESYTEQLESGREPGKFPPIKMIEKWIYDKGITPDNITVSSLAFLIARKISKEGWDRKDFGGVDLVSQVITPQRIQTIIDKVSEFHINSFLSEVTGMFKQMAA